MSVRRAERSLQSLLQGIEMCLVWCRDPACSDAQADGVSHWSVRAHLEHLLLADTRILDVLEQMASGTFSSTERGSTTLMGRLVLWRGRIPRGRGKAPDAVIPGDLSITDIETGFVGAHERFEALRQEVAALVACERTRAHPILGHYTAVQWLRFTDVHHDHHRRIIEDILRAAAA